MSGVAIYSVVHPAALGYFAAFWRSLVNASVHEHTVYLSLHGVEPAQLEAAMGHRVDAVLMPAPDESTPAQLRSDALSYVCAAHDAVILLDSDDLVLPGRMEAALDALETVDVYACAMRLIDGDGAELPSRPTFRMTPQDEAAMAEGTLLPHANAFGFSNSAYRAETLRAALPTPRYVAAMDWLVASRAYLAGARFAFDPGIYMAYRQYDANTARVIPPFGHRRILTDARRVVEHHRALAAPLWAEEFGRAASKSREFCAWLEADSQNVASYTLRLAGAARGTYLWWQHVDASPGRDSSVGEWLPS